MNEKVKSALEGILQRFESGDIPEAIAYSTFPLYDIPSARWSLLNRILMFIAGTSDAKCGRIDFSIEKCKNFTGGVLWSSSGSQ
jgi:hypothetical protein